MRIIFNVQRVGLGNNGGSGTVIKTANLLASMGNDVIISGDHPNKNTWVKLENGVRYIHSPNIPKGDVIIATGYSSVRSTLESSISNKFYYIRGFENWITSESKLLKSYSQLKCIVNSEWLKKYLSKNNIKSDLVYPGITELNNFYNSISVWMAPTELEGLHNCPIEASLAGCAIVSNDSERGGMSDYCINNETALVYKARDLKDASEKIKTLLEDNTLRDKLINNMKKLLAEKIGKRKDNAKKFYDILRGRNER